MISQRGAALVAALFLCGSLTLPANAVSYRQFSDVAPDTWYAKAAESINDAGIMPPGYEGCFSPATSVTVAEFSYSLLRSQGRGEVVSEPREAWGSAYLREMSRIMGEELADGPITRLQAAKMIAAVKQFPLGGKGQAQPFADTHAPAAVAVHREGIISGITKDGQLIFAGDETLNRAQMAVIIDRLRIDQGSSSKSSLYAGPDSFLIDPNIALPEEPKTSADFRQVMEYMVANDLVSLTLAYKGDKPKDFMADTKQILSDTLHDLRYERSEYFSYFPKTSLRTRPSESGYTLTIALAAAEGDTDEMLARRREAFTMARTTLDELYQAGTLTSHMSDRERAKAITSWVATNTKYVDNNARIDHTAWCVFVNGTGVCDGFSSALQLMLSLDNIQCWGQFGHVKQNGEPHQWTLALIDGEVFGIDAVRYPTSPAAFGMTKVDMEQFYTFD